jgi:cobalt-precorrin 5A hydrolase
MKLAVITLSQEGSEIANRLADRLPECSVFLHNNIAGKSDAERFPSITELTARIFGEYSGFVFVVPCGVAVRAVAPLLRHKTVDPAVVVVDVRGRWAVSLLSGHEGGANDLAVTVGNILAAEPIITTTSEAAKTLIVGIGCRRGIDSPTIVDAVENTLRESGLDVSDVRLLASADIKADEEGLLDAARDLALPLRFISSQEIRNCPIEVQRSDFVQQNVNLPAVAEPCALLAGRRTTLLVGKKRHNGVTVAVARENSSW